MKSLSANILMNGFEDGSFNLLDLRTEQIEFKDHRHKEALTDISFSLDLNRIFTISLDGTMIVYDLRNPNQNYFFM